MQASSHQKLQEASNCMGRKEEWYTHTIAAGPRTVRRVHTKLLINRQDVHVEFESPRTEGLSVHLDISRSKPTAPDTSAERTPAGNVALKAKNRITCHEASMSDQKIFGCNADA